VSVNYENSAGIAAPVPTEIGVYVDPLPADAESISGPGEVCANSTGIVYSISPLANALSYSWTVPSQMTILSGASTNSITVGIDDVIFNGLITVQAMNECGSGAISTPLMVHSVYLPPHHGVINGSNSVCQGSAGEAYSIEPVSYASGYVWTLPAGATITNGNNTNAITVSFSGTASSGLIKVFATNACGNGPNTPVFHVNVWPIPTAPVITYNSGNNKLASNQGSGNQWYLDGVAIAGATNKYYTPVASGRYTDIVTELGCSSAPSNYIDVVLSRSALVSTTEETEEGFLFEVYPNPNQGEFSYTISLPEEETLSLTIYNSIGIRVFQQKNIVVKKTFTGNINLLGFPEGLYVINFQGERTFLAEKVMKKN
jgi:hypothetical protein